MRNLKFVLMLAAAGLVWSVAGCGDSSKAPGGPDGVAARSSGGPLGSEQGAGPFKIVLTTDPAEPKAGDALFRAVVTRDGQPVKGAQVQISLAMPSMGMSGPTEALKESGGAYEGKANLSMGGEFEARVTAELGGESGVATFTFMVSQ